MKADLLSEANSRDDGIDEQWDRDNQQWWN